MIIIYIMRYFNDSPTFMVFSQVGRHGDKSDYHYLKAGFHMIADDRRSQKVLRSSAIIWKHTSAIACDRDRRRSQEIESCSIFCDHLRSFAILRSYGNQSSAICDRNVSYNIFNSDR